ncbi:MAG: KH domain-containing protein [Candidatus Gracilibacteria bacterium]|nr:KH domain-containing protein [Candidatus Gracilibacteria bacterium]
MSEELTLEQQFLQHIVGMIVTDASQIEVTRTVDDMGVLMTLKVAQDDMGRIIGKDGQTAKAIRTLLRVIGSRNNLRVNLKILEPGDAGVPAPTPVNEAGLDDDGDTTLEAPEEPVVIEARESTETEEVLETPESDGISFEG